MITRPHIDAFPAVVEIVKVLKTKHTKSAKASFIPFGLTTWPMMRKMQAIRSRIVWCVTKALILLELDFLLNSIANKTYPLERNPTTPIVMVETLNIYERVGEM